MRKYFMPLTAVAMLTVLCYCMSCKGKKEPAKEELQETIVALDSAAYAVDSIATTPTTAMPQAAAFVGEWNEPSGLQHNLVLKSDNTFEYQDFEKTKSGDLIDVMRQGTYTTQGDSILLKGNDGWQLTLHYSATNDEAHLTQGSEMDFVKE